MHAQQYAFRAQKCTGLVGGTPNYQPCPIQGSDKLDVTARTYTYSLDGRYYGFALTDCLRVFSAESAELVREFLIPNVVEFHFSPRGTFLSTWERPVKQADNSQHKNVRIFSVSTGQELASFTQKSIDGWDLQYTITESHAVRVVGPDIQVFHPANWSKGVVDKRQVEGVTNISLSPGQNPSIAVFVAEKAGKPATIRIYSLTNISGPPTCQKSAFRAEYASFKWNSLGTQVLVLIRTDVDATNKSYYGETKLYLLSAAGNFDCHVQLPKEGPIHDFTWSPNSKEFGVVCGYTPTKTVIFDQRVKMLHDFGTAPHNFIAYNPQGRLLALAGFGNMSGKLDIFDRKTLNKVTTIDAPNTTSCEWSPDGQFLLTATLSPRLRVDNGIKIWHCSGTLVHVQLIDELYQSSWRPLPQEAIPPFPLAMPTSPPPNETVKLLKTAPKAPTAIVGAYRPPGARGSATPSIYKREDEGGAAHLPSRGTSTPPRQPSRGPTPGANNHNNNGNGGHHNHQSTLGSARRHVPGAPPPTIKPEGEGKKGKKKKGGQGGQGGQGQQGGQQQQQGSGTATPVVNLPAGATKSNGSNVSTPAPATPLPTQQQQTPTPAGGGGGGNGNADPAGADGPAGEGALDPVSKKIRNLNKKLKAIDQLKEKATRGERLEATQVKKMEGEVEIRKELALLEASMVAAGGQAL